MLAALGPLAVSLCLIPFMPSFWTITVVVLCFFAAYYVYEPPYRGLYPDMLPASVFGRAQGVQHLLRGIALGCGLIGGTALFKLWTPAPFLLAAAVTLVACGAVVLFVQEDGGQGDVFRGVRAYLRTSWTIFRREPDVRSFLVVNAAWEAAFAAARVFVLLYFLNGLHESKSIAALGLSGVAVGYATAALLCGGIGDRIGLARTCFYASFLYGGGLVLCAAATKWHWWFPGFIFLFSLAGGTVMTLAWGLLFKLMPPSERGAVSGLATMTKGIGLVVGPLAAGAAIDLTSSVFPRTNGYQALWIVCAVPIVAVMPVVARLARHERARDRR